MFNFGKIFGVWIGVIVLMIVLGLLLVFPITWMWNFVMPSIFGLPEITYDQMFILYMLIQILFRTNVTVNK